MDVSENKKGHLKDIKFGEGNTDFAGLDIRLLSEQDEEALFNFEQEQREYFESVLPPRPKGYHQREAFHSLFLDLLEEQKQGLFQFYLIFKEIKSEGEILLGRINLTGIDPPIGESTIRKRKRVAELGYRLAKEAQGRGIGTKAVGFVQKEAEKTLKCDVLNAGTLETNFPSRRILENNGFEFLRYGPAPDFIKEKSVRAVYYRWKQKTQKD